ncbi:putative competence-damage inducible protein [Dirofilaria immitis]
MEMLSTVVILIFFTFVYSNQLDHKSLRRRCDSLYGTTCACTDPLVRWKNEDVKILKINEIYHGAEKIFCYIIEFINFTKHYNSASDAQDCTNLEGRYDVSMEPALFPSFRSLETLNLYLQQNFKIYQSQQMQATTGLSFDKINGLFWINNTNYIHESISPLIEQINTTESCLKFFLNNNKEKGPILRATKCDAMIPQYIRICYYAMNYIKPSSKKTDITHLRFKRENLSIITTNWANECHHFLWTNDSEKVCYVPVVKYFKRIESLHYNLVNKMCSKKFPWIGARIRQRQQISTLRNLTELFLKKNKIHVEHVPILIGLIHIRGMGFIWTSGNNGTCINSWDSSYDSLYDEMPFWIDPTFHPYLNTTEIHCHRFVIWTHTEDNYARAIPCEYPTNINLVLCEYDMKI